MTPIRVLLADDHAVFLDGLKAILAAVSEMTVVAEAMDGKEAVELATKEQPDVVVMDLGMPGLNGVEATRRVVSSSPATAVLVLTMYEDDEALFAALRAGARGYLLKGAPSKDVIGAIRAVSEGEVVFGAGVADRVLSFFRQQNDWAPDAFPALTDREREVLALVADDLDNTAIARKLQVSPKTVRNHVSNVFAKLHVVERKEAAARARAAGLSASGRWTRQV